MDHLILPKYPQLRPILIPCLTTKNFDGLEFATYPERAGWGRRSRSDWTVEFRQPSEEFIAFMQTWRFFGLISSILKPKDKKSLRIADLTRNEGKERVIDTSKLVRVMEDFLVDNDLLRARRAFDLESESQDRVASSLPNLLTKMDEQIRHSRHRVGDRFPTILQTLSTALTIERGFRQTLSGCSCSNDPSRVESLTTFISNAIIIDPLPAEIEDSIDLLLDSLTALILPGHCEKNLYDMIPESLDTYPPELNQILRSQEIHLSPRSSVISRMTKSGWCPSVASQLRQRFGISAMVFISNLERPDKWNHTSCTAHRCIFDKVDEKSYRRRHADGCVGGRSCFDVVADKGQMHTILKSGQYPIINAITQSNRSSIRLSDSQNTQEYIAVSHVWSDGLGNPKENAIPHCQLQAVDEMVANLPFPTPVGCSSPFWLDTLCCPVEESNDQITAIGLMRDTYEKASGVLVLDSSTLNQRTTDMQGDVEILMRIFRSRWTTRLWTLQEGALATRLFFQFSDGPYDVQEGIKRLQKTADMKVEHTIMPTILKEYIELRIFRVPNLSNEQKIAAVSRALQFRSTSVSTDEPVCLSTLLGFDTRKIMSVPPKKRYQRFWDLLPGIPSNTVFLHCTKMSEFPYRWAPQSFLRKDTGIPNQTLRQSYTDSTESIARFVSNGLRFKSPVMATGIEWNMPVGDCFYIYGLKDHSLNGEWYSIQTDMSNSGAAQKYSQPADRCNHTQERLRMLPPATQPVPRLFIVLLSQALLNVEGRSAGFLLSGMSTKEQISAQPICHVQVAKLDYLRNKQQLEVCESFKKNNWMTTRQSVERTATKGDTGNLFIGSGVTPTVRELCIG